MSKITRQLYVHGEDPSDWLMTIAFATSDRKTVDQHFGSAVSFSIYGISFERYQLLSVAEFSPPGKDDAEDKLKIKLDTLASCVAVYSRACGASAVRQLITRGIQPVKVSDGAPIEDLIAELQQELKEGPSSWLAKAMRRQQGEAAERFDAMDSDGWTE